MQQLICQIAVVCGNSHAISWLGASTQPTCENPIVTQFHTLGKNAAPEANVESESPDEVRVVLNWTQELKQLLAPPGKQR